MGIEELKIILETVEGIGIGALWVTIVYLVTDFLKAPIGFSIVVFGIYKIAIIIREACMEDFRLRSEANKANDERRKAEEERRRIEIEFERFKREAKDEK